MLGMTILLLARRFGLAFGAAVLAFHTASAAGAGAHDAFGISLGSAILGFFLPQVRVGSRNVNRDKIQ